MCRQLSVESESRIRNSIYLLLTRNLFVFAILHATALRMTENNFAFEDLKVYQLAIEWAYTAETILSIHNAHISRSFADQLSRASTSIALNIAEGNGRWHKAEKRQFLWIARGSTFECVAIIEILYRRKTLTPEEREMFRKSLATIGKMLTSLIKSQTGENNHE